VAVGALREVSLSGEAVERLEELARYVSERQV
jgi:hypothetical protein